MDCILRLIDDFEYKHCCFTHSPKLDEKHTKENEFFFISLSYLGLDFFCR